MLNSGFKRAILIALSTTSLCVFSDAHAACDATHTFKLDWDGQTTGSISKTAPQSYPVTNGAGTSATVTLTFSGDTANIATVNFGGTIGSVATPYIGAVNTGGLASTTEKTLSVGTIFDTFQSNIDSNVDAIGINFAFSIPVRDISFSVLDVDYTALQFRDWIKVTGTGPGGTYTPAITTPFGNNNTTNPGQTAPGVAVVGPYAASAPNAGNGEAVGNGASSNTQNYGNVSLSFPEPVTSVQIRYANGPAAYILGTPGQQAISVHDISFCPMPVLAVVKSAAPFDTAAASPDRFHIPGADVVYTLTIQNTGGSSVDANTIVLEDVLPGQTVFYNGDIDDGGPLNSNFEFVPGTSGLTLASGDLSYSNNAGANYTYTPGAGYDTSVNAVRIRPQGSMAANSTATIRFRSRIK